VSLVQPSSQSFKAGPLESKAVAVQVEPVTGRRGLADFVAVPYALHRGDPCWVAPLRRDVRAQLSRDANPFFEHAEAACFLARARGRALGRIAAIHNRLHNEVHGDSVGFFGFFESVRDPEVAAALLETAAGWLRARGLTVMRGPVSFSTNDEAGLLVDGFDTPPTVMMPHNPSYYAGLVEEAGLRKAKDLLVYRRGVDPLPPRLVEAAAVLERRHAITVRALDRRRFEAEVDLVKRLYNAAWERNWGFVPMTDREIAHLAKQLRPIVVPELVVFAERDGQPVGFATAVPDVNVALRRNPSGRLFPGMLKVWWAARRIERLRVLLLGTLPEWRGKGLDALLYKSIWEAARRKGYRWAEAGWVLEDNHAMRNALVRMGFEPYKTYRLYDRPL
jgi:GNAT superfamily N-acetyltransferase